MTMPKPLRLMTNAYATFRFEISTLKVLIPACRAIHSVYTLKFGAESLKAKYGVMTMLMQGALRDRATPYAALAQLAGRASIDGVAM